MKSKGKLTGPLAALLAGGIVGAIAGLLLAPRPGSELRSDISRRGGALSAKARSQVEPAIGALRQGIGPATGRVRDRVAPVLERMAARLGRYRNGYATNGHVEDNDANPAEESEVAAQRKQ